MHAHRREVSFDTCSPVDAGPHVDCVRPSSALYWPTAEMSCGTKLGTAAATLADVGVSTTL